MGQLSRLFGQQHFPQSGDHFEFRANVLEKSVADTSRANARPEDKATDGQLANFRHNGKGQSEGQQGIHQLGNGDARLDTNKTRGRIDLEQELYGKRMIGVIRKGDRHI